LENSFKLKNTVTSTSSAAAVAVAKVTTMTTTWEDLRRRARQLENDIDARLLSLNKLGVSVGGTQRRFDVHVAESSSEKSPLLSSQNAFEGLSAEIEHSLSKLREINEQMSDFIGSNVLASGGNNPALSHTLQRHREILRDYSQEFSRTRANIRASLEREQLLGSSSDDSLRGGDGLNNRRSDGFLKEHEHIRSSDRLLDEQISIAISTKENLQHQRFGMRDISKKMNILSKKYPMINSLMQKIHLRKRRDSIVIATVIGICLILLFIYATR